MLERAPSAGYNLVMLNIYYAGEACDKEKFIFNHIDPDEQTIIIVPDQASLQMERDALDYFKGKDGRSALLDLMVADFSSLGHKVISEAGSREPELIDKYGRQMLLSVLIDRLADDGELSVYKTMKGKSTFVSNTNQLISEMKRYGVSASDIEQAAGETDSYLQLKLSDINTISASESEYPVYIFFDDTNNAGIMYFYTEASEIYMHNDSSYAFSNNAALANLSALSNWNTSKVSNVSNLFSYTRSLSDPISEIYEEYNQFGL